MNKSETTVTIFKAISAAQGDFKTVEKTSLNPHFKSKFAPLDSIIEMLRPILPKHGLSFIQFTDTDDIGIIVETVIAHESGEWISGRLKMPATKQDPQGYGSALTYGRRYGLAAALGIVSDEDVDGDGNGESEKKAQPQQPQNQQSRTHQQPQKQPQSVGLTPSQQAYAKLQEWIDQASANKKKFPDQESFKSWFLDDNNTVLITQKQLLDASDTSAINRHFEHTMALLPKRVNGQQQEQPQQSNQQDLFGGR